MVWLFFITIQADSHILATRKSSSLRKLCYSQITVNIPLAGEDIKTLVYLSFRRYANGFNMDKIKHF
jgi:hypothetical protein